MPTQKPYTFAIPTSQHLTPSYKRVWLSQRTEKQKNVVNLKDN